MSLLGEDLGQQVTRRKSRDERYQKISQENVLTNEQKCMKDSDQQITRRGSLFTIKQMDSKAGGRRRSSGSLHKSSIKSVIAGIQRTLSTPSDKDSQDTEQILEDTDDAVKQPTYKSIDPDSQIDYTKEDDSDDSDDYDGNNCCVFCLDGGDLIHMCKCSVMAHKNCALDYIRFPGSMNGKCCQCRKTLEYTIVDGHTPMQNKYIIAFWSILFGYLALIGLSIFLSISLIPRYNLDTTLYVFMVANLSILFPLIIIYIPNYWIEKRYGPKNKTDSAKSSSGFGGEGCNCGGDGGDECGICLLILCFAILLFVQIAATVYIIMSLYRHYRSFALKSKKKIKFKHEKRPLNTTAYENDKCIV